MRNCSRVRESPTVKDNDIKLVVVSYKKLSIIHNTACTHETRRTNYDNIMTENPVDIRTSLYLLHQFKKDVKKYHFIWNYCYKYNILPWNELPEIYFFGLEAKYVWGKLNLIIIYHISFISGNRIGFRVTAVDIRQRHITCVIFLGRAFNEWKARYKVSSFWIQI